MRRLRSTIVPALVTLLLSVPAGVSAQTDAAPAAPAFSVATSHIFTTKEPPAITLTHRQVDHLDFRVYRVNDPFAFFARLRDAHELGSEEPVVAQEQTWLERIAAWKSARRAEVRSFVRRQFTADYRRARNARQDRQQVVLRRALNVNTFAQVPLLNASQLVTSWREILPRVREAEYRRVPLDLTTAGVYVVEAVNPPLRAYTVVIVSDVGLVTKTAPGELLVFAANRFDGSPLAGCRIQVLADQSTVGQGATSQDGTFTARLAVDQPDSLVTVADCNGQAAATDPGAFTVNEPTRELVGYTYTDRPVYRPGHTVHYRSVLRWRERGVLVPFGSGQVEVTVADGDEKVLLRERRAVDAFGSIDGSFTVPATAALGTYVLRVSSGDDTATGSFEVQEYRKPEFDVAVRPATRFARQGNEALVTISARYYFGQPVSGGTITYTVRHQPYFSPLRVEASGEEPFDDFAYGGGETHAEGTATLDAQGTAQVRIPLTTAEDQRDYTARIDARVLDVSGREVSGSAGLVATWGGFMLMATPDRYVHTGGDAATIRVRAVDYAGAPRMGARVHAQLAHVDYRDGYDNPRLTVAQEADVTTDAEGRAQWTVPMPGDPGSYRVTVTAASDDRTVREMTTIWVPGREDGFSEGDRFLELIADRRTYQPGDTARIMVQGEAFDAPVLVTKENQRISWHQVVRTSSGAAIEVPVSDDDIGDTYVSIAFLKDDRLFRAERRLSVPALARQLTIMADTDRPVARPGQPATFTLRATDAGGAPVRAQLSVGLVDEALYGVRPDSTPDPLRFFYRREYNEVSTSFSRDYPFVGYSGTDQLILTQRRRPMTFAQFKADRPDRPRVRKDFPDTVFWSATVTTDAAGMARVRVDYPDSLTTWRLTVRAVTADTHVGSAVARALTTKDLILRVVTPRFLTEGDRVEIPAIVHNYLPQAAQVAVTVSADGLTASPAAPAPGARSVQVAQNGQQRTDWAFTADAVRPVTISGSATSQAAGDAMALTIPVNPAGLQRNLGTSGSIAAGDARSLEFTVPPTANASGRSVRVALAPSLAGSMLGALDYLGGYPWGCTEQTLSSFVPNVVVLRALTEMRLTPTERLQSLDRRVSDGLKRLYDYQHDDGGWGWWKTDQNHPFMTAYAVDSLLQARDNGVQLEAWRIASGSRALLQLWQEYPRALPDLKAYIAYVLNRAQAAPFDIVVALDTLWEARARMSATGQSFLLMTLDARKDARGDTLARELMAAARTEGELSSWTAETDALMEDPFVDTSAEATALALKALAEHGTTDAVLERAARWLVANRNAGSYWVSTKQTAMALQGLLAFMKARGETPAPVNAQVLVNGVRVGTARFDAASLTAPTPVLIEAPAAGGANTIRIIREGAGAVYFDAGIRYYDRPAAAERTGTRRLAMLRQYFTLTPVQGRSGIVYREAPLAGPVKAGDLIMVRLTVAGAADWRYLMIEDPLPAGTESVEREDAFQLEQPRPWEYGSQRELRDDRTVYFLDSLEGGRREFNYLLRATTPGTFNAMPARVAPMYVPDVSASSDTMTLTVSPEGVP
ncbi:MAG: alpha-2-macroglobulin [Vicinamibacterales bacterium]